MTGHRGIRGIWQPELLQPRLSSSRRHINGGDRREEAVEQRLIQIGALERRGDRSADQPAAFAEDRDWMLGAIRLSEQHLLGDAALMPQGVELPPIDAVTLVFEALLCDAGQCQIHVVAAEQDVIADRDALEREIAVSLADQNQAEIGRPAADVTYQDEVADTQLPAPAVARAVNPCVAGGLRFL